MPSHIDIRNGRWQESITANVKAIEAAMESNFVVTSGGVSVGAYDFVKDALDKLSIDWNVFRVGQYKSAVEMFTRRAVRLLELSPLVRMERRGPRASRVDHRAR